MPTRIRISDFGPISSIATPDGWLDLQKISVFVGDQGSGKSTVAKLVSTFFWMEKVLVRGQSKEVDFTKKNVFQNKLLKYHRINDYFSANTSIEFIGNYYEFGFKSGQLNITKKANQPKGISQILYIPSERNFLSFIGKLKNIKNVSGSLLEFITDFENAKQKLKDPLPLLIGDSELQYDRLNDQLNIIGFKNDSRSYKLKLTDASSGFQSFVPLILVTNHHTNLVFDTTSDTEYDVDDIQRFKKEFEFILNNPEFDEEQKRAAFSVLSARTKKSHFINIVEEPEQNLYPKSQWEMLRFLIESNNKWPNNKLIITTHSPYLIQYLGLAVKAYALSLKARQTGNGTISIEEIIPQNAWVNPDELAIYEFDESSGTIKLLPNVSGLPSDENMLNNILGEGNDLFDQLLEIEQEL